MQEHPTNIKLPDGSVLYMSSFRDAPPDAVQERVLNHAIEFMWMEDFYEVDEELCTLFGRFVQYLQNQNIEVIFLLTPYHPVVYNNAMEYPDIYAGFFQTEPFFTNYAKKHDIPVYGSYNPFVAGTLDDDFFDGLHIKPEALAKLFPGVQEVQRLQQAGRGVQSLAAQPRPVEQTVAVQIVRQRYEIPQAEELRRDADEWIEGSACYVFGRYAPPEEGKPAQSGDEEEEWLLLARYAVSKDQGMIYRYDTDQEQWLVDRRGLRGVKRPGSVAYAFARQRKQKTSPPHGTWPAGAGFCLREKCFTVPSPKTEPNRGPTPAPPPKSAFSPLRRSVAMPHPASEWAVWGSSSAFRVMRTRCCGVLRSKMNWRLVR